MKYITILLIVGLCGCTQDIDLNLTGKKEVVVNCLLTYAGTQKLFLTYSNPYGKLYYDEIEQAKAILFEDEVSAGEFTKTGYSEWQLSFMPKRGKSYELRIEIVDRLPVSAKTTMPNYPDIEKESTDDSYTAKHFKQGVNNTYWLFAFDKMKDTIMVRPTIQREYKLLEYLGTNYEKADEFNVSDSYRPGSTTKTFLSYIRLKPDNVDNFYVEGNLYTGLIVFRATSSEYDLYLKSSISKMLVYQAFDDPSQWLDESEVYTNVTNGLGIFGAYADKLFNYNHSMPNQ